MDESICIDSSLFSALRTINLDELTGKDVSCVLPYLAKLLLNPYFTKRKQVLQIIYPIKRTNDILQLLRADPIDAHENINLPVNSFEQSQPNHRLRIVANEYIRIQDQARKSNGQATKFIKSDLFDNPLYVDDVSFCLSLLNESTAINILDISETLLHVKYGSVYIVRIVANLPDLCQEVCHSLVTHGETQDEGTNFNEVTQQRAKTLRMLCQMNPCISLTIRSVTIQLHKVPSLTIMITLDHLNKAMEKYQAESEQLMTDDDDETSSDIMADQIRDLEDTFDGAIAFITGILLGVDEETRNWFATYTKSAQQKRIDQNHFTVLSQFRSQLMEYTQKLFAFILEDSNQSRLTDPRSVTPIDCPSKKLIRATAILRLYCALRSIGMLKLNHGESEIILQLITSRLEADQTSVNFVTTGVCTLLVCSTLITGQRDEKRASEWLKWIISETRFNEYVPNLGKRTIMDLLYLIATRYQNNQTSEVADMVCETLGMKLQIKATVSRCRSLFQEVISDKMIEEYYAETLQPRDASDDAVGDETLNNIEIIDTEKTMPILCMHQLLENVETKSIELLGSSTASFLGVTINGSSHIKPSKAMKEDLERRFAEDFQTMNEDPIRLARTINNILILPNDEIGNLMDIFIENWSKLLNLNSSPENRKLIQLAAKLWRKFNTILPRKLWTMTVNSLRRTQTLKSELPHTWDELTQDPLVVLRCDIRVFRCPDILNIVLLILDAFLAASRRALQDRHNSENLKELRATLILAQTSAAVQILLEFCAPSDEEQEALDKRDNRADAGHDIENSNKSTLLERFDASVNCICEHIHQVFISDTNLAKLVHFQTYPSELLATTCDRIPSMHICLDYIPELISQPDQSKQVFVIQLASHLCEKYAITKSLNAAKLCFNVAYTLLQLLPSDKRALFYIPVLPALLRICKVFPILQEDTKIILNQINQITLAHMASTTSRLSLNSTKPFEGLDRLAWPEVEKLMQTLNLNEALYLCIQKCLSDVDNLAASTTTTPNNNKLSLR